jgi:hypothetical protein
MAEAGHPEKRGGVKDVGADDLCGRERKDEQHDEREECAAADRGQAHDEPSKRA